jgi:hypothetical protein
MNRLVAVRLSAVAMLALTHVAGCAAASAEDPSEVSEEALVGLANADITATMSYGQSLDVASLAGRTYRAVRFAGKIGDKVTLTIASPGDPRGWLIAPTGNRTLASNDDSEGTKNARITFTLTASGMHVVAFRDKVAGMTSHVSIARDGDAATGTDACTLHPWSMQNGCADRQGRSPVAGPKAPSLAWHVNLPAHGCGVRQLVVDAAGTAYAAQSGCSEHGTPALTAVRPDGTFAWTRSSGTISALALGADGNVYAYNEVWGSPIVHQFVKYAALDGAPSILFSESDNGGARLDSINPTPDGRIHFTGPRSNKVYDPANGSLADGPAYLLPRQRASLPGGAYVTSAMTEFDDAAHNHQYGYSVERHDAAGGLLVKSDGVLAWNAAPGGTVFGVELRGSGIGTAALVHADGSVVSLTTASELVREDGMNVAYGKDDSVALTYEVRSGANPGFFVAKIAKDGTRIYASPWRLGASDPRNIAIDSEGTVYCAGSALSASGAYLWNAWSNGTWHPSGNVIALAPNRTLLVASDLIGADTLSALRD